MQMSLFHNLALDIDSLVAVGSGQWPTFLGGWGEMSCLWIIRLVHISVINLPRTVFIISTLP
jgi:hypothetical protein